MPLWEVILRDPLNPHTVKKLICKREVEADTEYEAKRTFFTSLYKTHPTLPKTPFSAILPYLRTRNLDSLKPKTSEFPPESFFKEIRKITRKTSIEEELENSHYLPHIVKFITEEGLELNKIPKECPICRRPTETLEIHHWSHNSKVSSWKVRSSALINGYYRRMCHSCNLNLGGIFKSNYPTSWKNQLEQLYESFKQFPKTYNFPLEEGHWSLLSKEEWNRIKYIWDTTPKKMLREFFANPKRRQTFRNNSSK